MIEHADVKHALDLMNARAELAAAQARIGALSVEQPDLAALVDRALAAEEQRDEAKNKAAADKWNADRIETDLRSQLAGYRVALRDSGVWPPLEADDVTPDRVGPRLAAMTARIEAAENEAARSRRSEAEAIEMLRASIDARAALERYRYEVERALRSALAIGTWDDDVGAVGYIKRLREGHGTQADAWLAWGRDVLARHDARRPGEPARLSVPCGEAVRDEIGHIVSEVIYQARIAVHEKNCRCYAQARSTRARRALARWKGVAVRAKREHAAMARGLQGAYELNARAEGARYRAENAARRWKALARATRKRAASRWWLIGESLGAAALADYCEHWAREEAERRGRHLVEARRELAAARRDYDRWAMRKNRRAEGLREAVRYLVGEVLIERGFRKSTERRLGEVAEQGRAWEAEARAANAQLGRANLELAEVSARLRAASGPAAGSEADRSKPKRND
jgi:hypothetical protein